MNFVSYEELHRDVISFCQKLPPLQMVVGVPRSGLMVASLISLHLNIPLGCVRNGRIVDLGGGVRLTRPTGRVLVVDDSMDTGNALETVRRELEQDTLWGVIYKSGSEYHFKGDLLYERTVPSPRIFEWNLLNTKTVENACVDIDGVLCDDPEEYTREALEIHYPTALPRFTCHYTIGQIVTSRHERNRDATVVWLRRYGIQYKKLTMRRDTDDPAEYKAWEYLHSPQTLFFESDDAQARYIQEKTGKPVLCTDTMALYE